MNDNCSLIKKLETYNKEFIDITNKLNNDKIKIPKYLYGKYMQLEKIVYMYNKYKKISSLLEEANFIYKNDKDVEMQALANIEINDLTLKLNKLKKNIYGYFSFLKKEKNFKENFRNVILEIRSGTGGEEACLFVEDIFRMYVMYFKKVKWKYKLLSIQKNNIHGYKEVILEVNGNNEKDEVYGCLKFESGVHRVQRIPKTESQGRIHTSAITVAVLPKVKNIDVNICLSDIKKETFRSSGAGGQHVNKTESAVRITHLPSNITVTCQQERSQHKNFEKAMEILKARIFNVESEKKYKERSIKRKNLVSTGDRSMKIRTYNYPRNIVTDHRIKRSIYNLSEFMNGNIQIMIKFLNKQI